MTTGAVGIDLGTTFSAIAHVNQHGVAEILPNAEGDRITPSVIPPACRTSGGRRRWVVVAGWVTSDFASPRLLEISASRSERSTSKAAAFARSSSVSRRKVTTVTG